MFGSVNNTQNTSNITIPTSSFLNPINKEINHNFNFFQQNKITEPKQSSEYFKDGLFNFKIDQQTKFDEGIIEINIRSFKKFILSLTCENINEYKISSFKQFLNIIGNYYSMQMNFEVDGMNMKLLDFLIYKQLYNLSIYVIEKGCYDNIDKIIVQIENLAKNYKINAIDAIKLIKCIYTREANIQKKNLNNFININNHLEENQERYDFMCKNFLKDEFINFVNKKFNNNKRNRT